MLEARQGGLFHFVHKISEARAHIRTIKHYRSVVVHVNDASVYRKNPHGGGF